METFKYDKKITRPLEALKRLERRYGFNITNNPCFKSTGIYTDRIHYEGGKFTLTIEYNTIEKRIAAKMVENSFAESIIKKIKEHVSVRKESLSMAQGKLEDIIRNIYSMSASEFENYRRQILLSKELIGDSAFVFVKEALSFREKSESKVYSVAAVCSEIKPGEFSIGN